MGNAASEERDKHNLGLMGGDSTAMIEHQAELRKASLKAAAAEIDAMNKKE